MKIDITSETSGYMKIGDWVVYVDDSTGEKIIHSWIEDDVKYNASGQRSGDILEHSKKGTRTVDYSDHEIRTKAKENTKYINDMLGEHKYKVGSILYNSDGHEVRDLNGNAIFIDSMFLSHYDNVEIEVT
mgnify:FL=1|jgi:hypothetical protein|tara:strand:+ start:153 stop:542 length:390 start_codon:yes stop_codon:yes gene_type:complete